MSAPAPSMPPGMPTAAVPVDSSSGLWDRLTNWTSENKAVAYTIAGVAVVVTGAGVAYYLNDSVRPTILHLLAAVPAIRYCGLGCCIEPCPIAASSD